jgi:hypothetical protein
VVLAVALPSAGERRRREVDYAGTVLLGVCLSALVLLTTLGGTTYDWSSVEIIGLGVVSAIALARFIAVERRVSEPVLAPELFANPVFRVTSVISLVVGFALFGSLTFLPLFQQVVRGLSPTESGLQLIPLMVGVLGASIGSGQIVARTGRYRVFPIVGTAVATIGLLLLSTLDEGTTDLESALYMFVLGLGLGLVMQVLVLAMQNAVPYAQLGVATSAATLFRSIGGSLGTAILGAIFSNRLSDELAAALPSTPAARTLARGGMAPEQVQSLPPRVHDAYINAFVDSFSTVFQIAAGVVAVAFLLSWFLEERPLRRTIEEPDLEGTFAAPQETDSLTEITRQLGRLVGRERTRQFIEGVIDEADVDATAAEAWLLGRARDGHIPGDVLEGPDIEAREALAAGAARLRSRRLVEGDGDLRLTAAGADLRGRLLDARCRRLESLVADWEPESPEVDAMIERLAEELARTAPPKEAIRRPAAISE